MKRLFLFILTFSMVMGTIPVFEVSARAAAAFAGGDGSPENPYQVSTPEQLNNVRDYLSACLFK